MTSFTHEFHRYADVQALLADPHLVPPPVEPGPVGSVAWLRATVARFSSGETHARRRALVQADLARLDPAALRKATSASPDGDAHRLAVRALAEGLRLAEPDAVAQAVEAVAGAYFGGDEPHAEAAMSWLLPHVLDGDPAGADPAALEVAANRIGLLVQAYAATGDLIEHSRHAADGTAVPSIEALLAETLRHDPPVRLMRRVALRDTRVAGVSIAAGDLVLLDIAVANRDPDVFTDPDTFNLERSGAVGLTFGSWPRACPARDHALALAAGALDTVQASEVPVTDDRDPAEVVVGMVDHVLALAATWTAWDGHPRPIGDRIYTPHKAIRRVADHLVDHLAELEAHLAGQEPQPDQWHASTMTTAADLAPFTPDDLDEARSRLTRLASIWAYRLGALSPERLDHQPGGGWTPRQLAFHITGSAYYADAVGDLTPGLDAMS